MHGAQTNRWTRVGRAFAVSSFAVFVAAMSHLVAGGHTPGILGTIVALVFGTIAAMFALGRRVTLPRLVLAVAVGQLVLHVLFSMNGSWGGPVSGHHEEFVATTTGGTAPEHSLGMTIAHVIAGLIAVLALRAAQLSAAELALLPGVPRILMLVDVRAVPLPVGRQPRPMEPTRPRPHSALLAVAPRRGPPTLAV